MRQLDKTLYPAKQLS